MRSFFRSFIHAFPPSRLIPRPVGKSRPKLTSLTVKSRLQEAASSSSAGTAPLAKAVAAGVNQLEEAAGPAVTLRDFQARRAGYEDYLRNRSRAALYISNSELVRTYLSAVRCVPNFFIPHTRKVQVSAKTVER